MQSCNSHIFSIIHKAITQRGVIFLVAVLFIIIYSGSVTAASAITGRVSNTEAIDSTAISKAIADTIAAPEASSTPTIQPSRPNRPTRPERRHISPITTDTFSINEQVPLSSIIMGDSISLDSDGQMLITPVDSITLASMTGEQEKKFTFTPDPSRAVWLSALFPGLGQLYNRRYWKLPIVVGAFLGLGYATNWNNTMLRDYTTAYSDIMDNDPTTKSYMDFFAPTVKESDLDKQWLTNLLRTRKNYYRRNRDLCIICMIGVYLVAMVDAYVDAQLAHFDISDDLSMDLSPTLMNNDIRSGTSRPSIGLYWALTF